MTGEYRKDLRREAISEDFDERESYIPSDIVEDMINTIESDVRDIESELDNLDNLEIDDLQTVKDLVNELKQKLY